MKQSYSVAEPLKISVIIPAYNLEKYIRECVESVQRQGMEDIEIICIDDASIDATRSIIMSMAEDDDRIKIINNEKNMGAAYSRNAGVKKAAGKYIYFLDGDDLIKEGMFERLFYLSEEYNLDILSFSGEAFVDPGLQDDNQEAYKKYRTDAYIRTGMYDGLYDGKDLFMAYMANDDITGNMVLQFIKRSFFIDNDLYMDEDIRYADDSPFGLYMCAKRAMCISDVYYRRRYREESAITSIPTLTKAESSMLSIIRDLRIWEDSKTNSYQNEQIVKFFWRMHQGLLNIYNSLDTSEKTQGLSVLDKHPMARYVFRYFFEKNSVFPGLTDIVLEDCKKSEKLILFGAGKVAKAVSEMLKNREITDYRVVVSKKQSMEQRFCNRVVYEVNEVRDELSESMVIVAVGRTYKDEIVGLLKDNGCKSILTLE